MLDGAEAEAEAEAEAAGAELGIGEMPAGRVGPEGQPSCWHPSRVQ